MKILSVIFACALNFVPAALGASNYADMQRLVSSVNAKRGSFEKKVASGAKLASFFLSPESPRQGDELTAFIQLEGGFEEHEVVLYSFFEGAPVPVNQPTEGLWVADLGSPSLTKEYELKASLSMRNREDAKALRDAIVQIDADIAVLTDRIANETDPAVIAQLEAERSEALSVKGQLVAAMAGLLKPLGEQKFNFSVRPASNNNPNYPRISNVFPNVVKADGGATLNVLGTGFGPSPSLYVGGGEVSVLSANSGSISAQLPVGLSQGVKSIEVRFTQGGIEKNAVFRNAFFVTTQDIVTPVAPPTPPVAVVNQPKTVPINTPTQLSAMGSYDLNGQPLSYDWRIVSKPSGSALPVGLSIGSEVNIPFIPDLPGSYVIELRVAETTAPFAPAVPVYTVIQGLAPANRAPVAMAGSIVTPVNSVGTRQIIVSDLDRWQQLAFHIARQGSRGVSTINEAGYLTYSAGGAAGSDSVEVLITDNGTPQAATRITIPVTVGPASNQSPVIVGPIFRNHLASGPNYLVGLSVNAVSDPDGSVSTVEWDFGDGTVEAGLNNGFADVTHNYAVPGTYSVTLRVKDSQGGVATLNQSVDVIDTDIPKALVTASSLSGPVPFTVTMDGSASSDLDGISLYRYSWRDGSPDQEGAAIRSHTFTNPGTYQVRLRVRDANRAQSEALVNVYAGVAPPALGSPPWARITISGGRQKVQGSTFTLDGSESYDPNPSGSIANYAWTNGDYTACPVPGGCGLSGASPTTSYSLPSNYYVGLTVTNSAGAVSQTKFEEVWAVTRGAAPKPIVSLSQSSGVAPLTIMAHGLLSYDYDGMIVAYRWSPGVFPCAPGNCNVSGSTMNHTYDSPGVYFLNLEVEDNDGNKPKQSMTITVNPSYASLAATVVAKTRSMMGDPKEVEARERRRSILAGACSAGSGAACFDLSQVYAEDGDGFTSDTLKQRACSIGEKGYCQ